MNSNSLYTANIKHLTTIEGKDPLLNPNGSYLVYQSENDLGDNGTQVFDLIEKKETYFFQNRVANHFNSTGTLLSMTNQVDDTKMIYDLNTKKVIKNGPNSQGNFIAMSDKILVFHNYSDSSIDILKVNYLKGTMTLQHKFQGHGAQLSPDGTLLFYHPEMDTIGSLFDIENNQLIASNLKGSHISFNHQSSSFTLSNNMSNKYVIMNPKQLNINDMKAIPSHNNSFLPIFNPNGDLFTLVTSTFKYNDSSKSQHSHTLELWDITNASSPQQLTTVAIGNEDSSIYSINDFVQFDDNTVIFAHKNTISVLFTYPGTQKLDRLSKYFH